MNIWLRIATLLLFSLIPCIVVCLRGDALNRFVGLQTANVVATLLLLLLAEGFDRIPFYDLALTLALLSFGGGLVFTRFFER